MNLPNFLATLRIILAPVLFFLLVQGAMLNIHQSWVNYFAALAFGIAALTDFFDGYIARAWGQKTRLGAILDPLADKMLILAAFVGILLLKRVDIWGVWAIYLILVREFFITGFRVVMVAENLDISASFAGKLKTAFQMIAVIFLIMEWNFKDFALFSWRIDLNLASWLLGVAFVLTMYSGFEYIYKYAKKINGNLAKNSSLKSANLKKASLKNSKNFGEISMNLKSKKLKPKNSSEISAKPLGLSEKSKKPKNSTNLKAKKSLNSSKNSPNLKPKKDKNK